MNMWAYRLADVRMHMNDVFMIALMTGWMLLFTSHGNMLVIGAFIAFVLVCIRYQLFVDDRQYLNGMIPHHSMAILMSQRIKDKTRDPRVRALAEQIIQSQEDEIRIMNELLSK